MKRTLITAAVLTLGVAAWFGVSSGAAAKFSVDAERTLVKHDQTVDGSWYGTGERIMIDGVVNGDVYCAGQTVEITGQVKGDVLCAAQDITFADKAAIDGSVRLAAQNIVFDDEAQIVGNASVLAQNVSVKSGAWLGQDLNGAAQNVVLKGEVGRDVAVAAESIQFDGTIGRDVDAAFETAQFGKTAKVTGNFTYTADQESSAPRGFVNGEIVWHESKQQSVRDVLDPQTMIYAALTIVMFVMVVALVLPRFLDGISQAAVGKFGLVLGVGALTALGMIAVPLVGLILLLLPLTTYLGIALLVVWVLWMLALTPAFGYYLGRLIPHGGNGNVLMNAMVGVVVLAIALQIPYLGGTMAVLVFVLGNGLLAVWAGKNFHKPSFQTTAPALQPKLVKKTPKDSEK